MQNLTSESTIKPIKASEKLGFGTFSTASNVVYQFKSLYYLLFLTNVIGIHVVHAGIIIAIGTVWDAVNDPMVGYWAVNHTFKNGEKCRPFALWCALPWALTVVLMFTQFNVSYPLKIALAIIVYLVFELFNTFVAIPYNSMGGLATNRDSDRRSINVARNMGGCIGSGIGAVACLPLVKLFGGLDAQGNIVTDSCEKGTFLSSFFSSQSARGFFFAALVMGVVCIVGSFAHYFTTKERIKQEVEDESHLSFAAIVKILFGCRSWVFNMFYIICYGVVNMLIMSSINYYATYVMGSTGAATLIMAVYLVTAIVVTLLTGPIDKALGRKKMMMMAAFVMIIGKIWFVINPYSAGAIYVNAISFGIGITIAFIMFNTNRNNISDLVEWQSGRRIDSMVSTVDNLASKLATAGASLLMTSMLGAAGFDAALPVQPDTAIQTINALLGWVPLVISVLMLIVAYFLDIEKEMKDMHTAKSKV